MKKALFMQVYHPILKMKELSSTDKLILSMLLSIGMNIKTNKDNEITVAQAKFIYLSNQQIADHIDVSIRTVKSSIKKLKELKLINVFYSTANSKTQRKIFIAKDRIVEMIYRIDKQKQEEEEFLQDYAIKPQSTTLLQEPEINYGYQTSDI